MKIYHLTEGEIGELSSLGTLASVMLGLGTFALGMAWDIGLALDTSSAEAVKQSFLKGFQIPTAVVGVGCLVISGFLVWRRRNRSEAIKKDNKFSDIPR